jgi:hypothetical protein
MGARFTRRWAQGPPGFPYQRPHILQGVPTTMAHPQTFLARRTNAPEILIPLPAGPGSSPTPITSGAVTNTFGAWTAIGNPVTNDFYLSSGMLATETIPFGLGQCWLELSYGAAGGANALDFWGASSSVLDPAPHDDTGFLWYPMKAHYPKVPAGNQIWGRFAYSQPAVIGDVLLAGFDSAFPVFTVLPHNAPVGVGRCYPNNLAPSVGANFLTVAGAVWPAFGAGLDIINPAPNDLLLTDIMSYGIPISNSISTGVMFQLGYNAGAGDVWVASVIVEHGNPAAVVDPPVWVMSGEIARIRQAGQSVGAKNVKVKVYDF